LPAGVLIPPPQASTGGGGPRRGQGKSALLSWFVLHPPPGVRIVSFFVTARLASQDDRTAFIDNVMEQLLTLLDQPQPQFLTDTTREAHLLGFLTDYATMCRTRGEQCVLIVDGLDEDRGTRPGADGHSIAALLPAQPPEGMRVIAASRANPPIPDDVAADHPLRDPGIRHELVPSSFARGLRLEMKRELATLLAGPAVGRHLLGCLVAAGGGLSALDLAALTDCPFWQVDQHLASVAGRSFIRRPSYFRASTAPEIYLLTHEELDVTAREQLGQTELATYRSQLHVWAQGYQKRGWPEETPHTSCAAITTCSWRQATCNSW